MTTGAPVPATLRELVEQRAALLGERDFALAAEHEGRIGFSTLHDLSRSLAQWLARRGLRPGDRVAWLLPNGLMSIRLLLGSAAAGFVATPLSLLAQAEQLTRLIKHAGVRIVFVDEARLKILAEALNDLPHSVPVVVVDSDNPCLPREIPHAAWPWPDVGANAPALRMYTSGTTGRPKSVTLSHANLLAGAGNVTQAHLLCESDRVLGVLPLYHINAQVVTAIAPLVHGGSVVIAARFSASEFWRQAINNRCTWINVVPTMIAYLLAGPDPRSEGLDISALKFCRSASAPLPPEQQRAFEARFGLGIVETMGLTETAGPIVSNPLDASLRKIGSPGVAIGNELRIADPIHGLPCPLGVSGEIQVRGPNVMGGYDDVPENGQSTFTDDGWFRTGDLGFLDSDGFVFVTGRIKELIIKGGENIAPREIDEALLRHPDVLEAAALGIPDPLYGQEIVAGVVLRPGARIVESDLIEHCRRTVGNFKGPKAIRMLETLPKGPSGKIQRLRVWG